MWQQLKDWLKSQTEDVEALKQSNHYLRDATKTLEGKLSLKEKEYDNLLSSYVNLKVQLDLINKSHDLSNSQIPTQAGECLEPQKLDIS